MTSSANNTDDVGATWFDDKTNGMFDQVHEETGEVNGWRLNDAFHHWTSDAQARDRNSAPKQGDPGPDDWKDVTASAASL